MKCLHPTLIKLFLNANIKNTLYELVIVKRESGRESEPTKEENIGRKGKRQRRRVRQRRENKHPGVVM